MRTTPLADDVRQFIRENIHSVEQLEVLLLLRSEAQKEWSVVEVSQRLFSTPSSVAMRLTDLHSHGLIQLNGVGNAARYSYGSTNSNMDRTIANLDRAYRERKTSVIEAIFSRPPSHVQAFADAFRLRRND